MKNTHVQGDNSDLLKVSFIVVTFQRLEFLKQCLQSIYLQEALPQSYEIVVIDNSGDAVIPLPPRPGIQVRHEKPATNLGAAEGRNLGMELARGEYFIGLDDDAVWHSSNDVARMVSHLDRDNKCGAVAVKSLMPNGGIIVPELPHPNKRMIMSSREPIEVPYFYTMGIALRAEVFHKVGGYPSRFGIYMEEVDLSLRLLDAGYKILYDPEIAVIHYKSPKGRPIQGSQYWLQSSINKARIGWRLLPFPYPLTIMLIWSFATLIKTRSLKVMANIWKTIWGERGLLKQERHPIRFDTILYLRRIGARLLY